MIRERGRPTTVVTGGAGFVGREIVASLGRAGHHTIVVDRSFDSDLELCWKDHPSLRMVQSDARDLVSSLDEPAQYIVHAAAITGAPKETQSEPETQFIEAVETVGSVLRWARHRGVIRTVLISSGAVFGGSSKPANHEDSRPAPDSLYASAKLAAELFGEAMRKLHGQDVVVVRLGNLYGPGERARRTRPRTSLVHRMLQEAIDARTIRLTEWVKPAADWTLAADIADALEAVLSAEELAHGLYHLTQAKCFQRSKLHAKSQAR